ncbi:hypothetical protein DFH29DRAFT_1002067 [Suillus ampliporus]|nr:hypothetical protein DFH29DRAFT_1002067 [Suillus ampliporus]
MENHDGPFKAVFNAYCRLPHDELVLFLKVRNLPTSGTDKELASRLAQHDFHTYHFHFPTISSDAPISSMDKGKEQTSTERPVDLPVEVLADIFDHLGDWELSRALGIPTSLSPPTEWNDASPIDLSMLTGSIPIIRAADPAANPPSMPGAIVAVRFGYVNVLEFFVTQYHPVFLSTFKDDLIPFHASKHGRTAVLSWWKHGFQQHPDLVHPPKPGSIARAIDRASRSGQVESLDWWVSSGLPLDYTEAALEGASAKNRIDVGRVMELASQAGHVDVLKWWATSQVEYTYDRHVMHHASCVGKVEVLQWWLGSGLQIIFDQDVLTGATRHNRSEVLEWWDKSGLPIQYRMCDIEEALEDAIGGGDKARRWWKNKGVDFHADDKEWMKLQNLN